ncbi:unnamed protein product, partial [Closterium sp. NIES-54]
HKYGPDGELTRYKSRLVAKGFQQTKGKDFDEIFAPVGKGTTLRVMLGTAANRGWRIKQMDITTAFLNGIIQEELYMLQPEGLDDGSVKVCRLKKAIYGLKQAPRAWYHKLEETLLAGGFKKSECDHSLFLLQEKEQFLMLLVYVDNILLFSESSAMIERVEEMLEMKYCEGLAEKYGLQDGGKPATPLPSGFTVEPCADEEVVGESDRKLFHSMMGALNYAANHTRPDIAFATSRLACVVSRPSHEQLEAAKRLVRYVSATASLGLEYSAVRQRLQRGAGDLSKGEMLLTCYTDASFNSVKADGTSIGGYVCLFGGGAVSWRSKKQNEVGLSSCETEYMALHHGVKEVVWLKHLLEEIGVCQREPKALYDAVIARYSSPATAALGRLLLPYLFPELSAFATVEDLVSHLRTSVACYCATVPAEFLYRNQPPMFITLYFIVTRLPDSLRSVRDHFLALDPTSLTVDLLEQHLLAAETSAVALASAAAADVPGAEDIRAASASAKHRSGKGKGSRGGGGGSGSGGGGSSGAVEAVEVVAAVGVVAGVGELVAAVEATVGVAVVAAVGLVAVGQALGVVVLEVASGSSSSVGARPSRPSSFTTSTSLAAQISLGLDFDAILSAMYALSVSAEGDCYRCVPPDPGVAATALGASESGTLPGTAPAEALHTFTLDSGASRCFFRDSTTLTPLPAPIPVQLANPSRGPVVARSSTVLLCPAVGFHPLARVASCRTRPFSGTTAWVTPPCHTFVACTLVSFRSRPPLPPSPAPPCLPCVEGRQRAAPHSSFPPTIAPLQTLHMDVWGPARVIGQGRERYFLLVVDKGSADSHYNHYTQYATIFPLHSKSLVFSSNLLRDFCRGEGILQSFTLPDSPQQNGITERRIGLVMEVARTSMIDASTPHFLWPFAVQYAAHQLNLWPRVSLPETSPTLHWTGKVGDASVHRVWGSRAFVRDPSADKLSARAITCDVTFDESVPFYRLFPYHSAPLPPPPLFLAPGPPPEVPFPPHGPAPLGFSQVDPPPGAVPGEVAVDSAGSAETGVAQSGGAETRGAEPGGAETGGGEPEGVEPRGAASEGAESGGAEPQGAASSGGSAAGGAGVAAGGGVTGGTAVTGPEGALTRGTGAAGTGGVGGAEAGDPTESGAVGAGGSGACGAGAGGAGVGGIGAGGAGVGGAGAGGAGAGGVGAVDPGGAVRPRPYFVPLLRQVLGVPSSSGLTPTLLCPPPDNSQPPLQPASPLPSPSPYIKKSGGLTERRERASRPVSPVCTARRVPCSRPPLVPGTHAMALRPSSVPLRVALPAPPESSLPEVPDPESDRAHAAKHNLSRLLAT